MLEFKNVTFQYEGDEAPMMTNLSFSVEEGDFVSIIGASGCGKSTIFRLINGLEQLQQGEILVDGKPVSALKQYSAFMPQKDLLFPWRTVADNVRLPLEIRGGMSKAEMNEKVQSTLQTVGLGNWGKKSPSELSGGMRQRAAFARTVLTGSDLLLLDEPFSALDFLTRISMQEWLLDQWQRHEKTILFITHDVEEAVFLSSSVLVVEKTPIQALQEIPVPMEPSRTRPDLKRPEIADLREQLVDRLRKQVTA